LKAWPATVTLLNAPATQTVTNANPGGKISCPQSEKYLTVITFQIPVLTNVRNALAACLDN
jgi:hypothetical protein